MKYKSQQQQLSRARPSGGTGSQRPHGAVFISTSLLHLCSSLLIYLYCVSGWSYRSPKGEKKMANPSFQPSHGIETDPDSAVSQLMDR